MTRRTEFLLALSSLALACQLDTEDAYYDYLNATDGAPTDAMDESVDGTGSTGTIPEPIETSTSGPSQPPTDDAPQAGPTILSFSADPPVLNEAGPVTIQVEHTPDVAAVMLFDVYDGATQLLAELGPDEPWTYAITSESAFEGVHELHAIAVDEHDRWAEAETELAVDLPPGGSAIWVNEGEGDESPLSFALAAAALDSGVVLAGIDLNAGSGHAFARLYSGDSGELQWTYKAPAGVYISDVEADPSGGVVLVGHVDVDDTTEAWVHHLDPDGEPSWPSPIDWLESTAATAVAVDKDGGIFVTGDVTKQGMFEHTDIFVWHLPAEGQGMPAWAIWDSNVGTAPFDHATSITITESQRVFVGGAATVESGNNNFLESATVFEYNDTEILKRWSANSKPTQVSRGFGLAAIENDIVVVGWQRESLNDPEARFATRLHANSQDAPITPLWTYPPGPSVGGRIVDIVRDPNDRLVMAGTSTGDPSALSTIAIHGSSLPSWSKNYVHLGNGEVLVSGLATDFYGYIYFTGTIETEGTFRTVIGKRRP